MGDFKTITINEVQKHNKEDDIWIIVEGKVFDVTKFLELHPGGKTILLKVAGTDATKQFNTFHSKKVLEKYIPKLCIGQVETKGTEKQDKANHLSENAFGDMVPFGDPSWYQDWNSPYYNESHRKLRKAVREFVDREIMPNVHEWAEANSVPKEVLTRCSKLGIASAFCGKTVVQRHQKEPVMGIVEPKDFDAFHSFIVLDEFSRCGSGGLTWALNGGMAIGLPPVVYFGSKELQDKIVQPCLRGEKFMSLAVTEPYAGSDVANLQCSAKRTPDGKHYIVNGEKKWITNGTFADYFTVAVRTSDKPGMEGISLLLLERNMPGLDTRQMKCTGVWGSGTAFVNFNNVKVPVENLIGEENKGFRYIMFNFNNERLGLVYQANRFARVCYEEAFKYAHQRKTFGKRLVDHAVIRNKLAHMARNIEATHHWIEATIHQFDTFSPKKQATDLAGPIALLKAQATQTFALCATEATQIFGGLAYTRGGRAEKVERLYRDVRAMTIPGGSEEIMLDLGIRQSMKLAQLNKANLL
ncbi:acyl-CoA dehydrogenase NM domain-like protein [Neoconidiobolus thromboides FSU 785]|nr:acyl-CoA dehydrogenase NM domain-like protein [Neoconidiobolus thromboides FSU 785]